jgi:Cu/Ag efflux protein CusF
MKKVLATFSAALLVFLIAASAYAESRPHEGKITRIDEPAMMLSVQGEKGDAWDIYLTETTKLKKKLTFGELREGDSVDFLFVEKDGKKWATELHRTHKAKS